MCKLEGVRVQLSSLLRRRPSQGVPDLSPAAGVSRFGHYACRGGTNLRAGWRLETAIPICSSSSSLLLSNVETRGAGLGTGVTSRHSFHRYSCSTRPQLTGFFEHTEPRAGSSSFRGQRERSLRSGITLGIFHRRLWPQLSFAGQNTRHRDSDRRRRASDRD